MFIKLCNFARPPAVSRFARNLETLRAGYVRLFCCIIPNLMNGLDCVLRHKAFVALKVDAMLLYC